MPFQVSPGVNVSEIDLTTVVPAVSTTEGGFVGQFRWGPVEQRILVDSEDRLVNIFQKPTSNTADDFFTAANFLSYGNALYVVRGVPGGANNASTSAGTAALIKNEDSTIPANNVFYAKYAGELGNSLKISVCPSANAWSSNTGYTYNATRNSDKVTITSANSSVVSTKINIGDLLKVGNSGKFKVNSIAQSAANASHTTVTLASKYDGANLTGEAGLERNWQYQNQFDQAPGTTETATNLGATNDALHVAVVDEDGAFTGTKGTVLETYENLSKGTDAKTEQGASNYFADVIKNNSGYVTVSAKSYLGSATLATGTFAGQVVLNYNLAGGSDGATDITSEQKIVGYDLFKSAEDVDLSFVLGGNANATLATYLISSIAESRKDCVAVISPERADVVNNNSYAGKERDAIIAFRDSLPSSSYAVMDSGWKYQYDKYNDVYRYVPLNADTAGLMVQTDLTRDPWYSPAGYNRGNVKNAIKLAYNPSKGDRDQLYKKNINPVVTFPGQGTVLFGDKTMLAKPSAFDRINVRRLFIVLEKAISTAAKFTLFEFNDEFTRSQFNNLVVPFLRDVQGRRGITDFQVVCDSTNNTGEVIDRNEFIGDIYIKPARSINFIQLNFVAVRSGVEFSEVVGRA